MGYSYGYLAKIGNKGNLLWDKEYPRGNYYVDFASVFSCKDGGFITLGTTEGKFVGDPDYIATKTDSLGNTQLISILNQNEINPSTFKLFQNYPNPFNNSTIIEYHLSNYHEFNK